MESSALDYARSMFGKNRLSGTFHKDLGEIRGQLFDVVILAEVLEHVEDPGALLRKIALLLSPGGVFIMTTPIRLLERPFDPHHVHEFWLSELDALLRQYFETVEVERMHPA